MNALLEHDPAIRQVECHNCRALSWASLCDSCGPDPRGGYGECELCGKVGPISGYSCVDCEEEHPWCDVCEGPCRGRHVFYDERWSLPAGAGRLEGESWNGVDFELIDAVIELLHIFKGRVWVRVPGGRVWADQGGRPEGHTACPPEILTGLMRRDLWARYAGPMIGSGWLQLCTPRSHMYAASLSEVDFLERYPFDSPESDLMRDAGSWLMSLWPGGDNLPASTEAYDVLLQRWAETRDCSLSGCVRSGEP